MKNITFKDITNRFPNISMEKGIAVYGAIALLKEKVNIRKAFAEHHFLRRGKKCRSEWAFGGAAR